MDNTSGFGFSSGLISPIFDFSADSSVMLSFRSHVDNVDFKMTADVDVSGDGGATWVPVWEKRVSDPGPTLYQLDVSSQAAGKSAVRFRFRALSQNNSLHAHTWQIDEVQVNQLPQCITQPGALLIGKVTDANTGLPLVGVTLTAGSEQTVSAATAFDAAQPDGFYQLWVPQNITSVAAALDPYAPANKPVVLAAGSVTWQDLSMQAGSLTFLPSSLNVTLTRGEFKNITMTVANSGGAAATFSLTGTTSAPLSLQPVGPFAGNTRLLSPKRLHELDASHLYFPGQPSVMAWPEVSLLRSFDSGNARAWGLAPLPDGSLWIGAASRLELTRYNAAGQPAGPSASQLPWVGGFGADLAYQPLTGRLWQVNVGGDNCIYELDAAGGQPTHQKICPSLGASQRGLAFDPLSGTFYSGSWTDGILNHFDAAGQLLDSTATGLNLAGLAYHPVSKHLYVLVNAADGADVYVLDTANHYQVLGGFNIAGMTHFGQSGLEFSEDGHLWALDGSTGQVYELAVGEPRVDAWVSLAWLNVQPVSGSVAAGSSQNLAVQIDSSSLMPGVYKAYLLVTQDTPYTISPLTVNLTVESNGIPSVYLPMIAH